MPKNLRGDFVYVDVSNGKILSNRTDLVSKVKLRAAGKATAQERALAAVGQTRRPMSYPPTGGASTGLYIRWYSPQGMNALWGYATPPCDAQFNNPSADTGYMYFNAYSGNSQTGGSVVDAGVAQGLYPHNSQTLNAYINVTGNFLYSGWTNETQTYQCSSSLHLNMLYGTLDDGSDSVLMVGVPSFDPEQFQLPVNGAWVTISHAAWNFFPTPYGLQGGADGNGGGIGSYGGYTSPCTLCSVARMFGLAEANGPDGSCNGSPDGRWDQVVAGNLQEPCQPTPQAECWGEWWSSWIAGGNDYNTETGGGGVNYSDPTDNEGLEGLNDAYSGPPTSNQSVGRFSTSLPALPGPACTPDSLGYCDIVASKTTTGLCNTGLTNIHGAPIDLDDTKTSYYIFQMSAAGTLEEVALDTNTISYSGTRCTTSSNTWAPSNPSTQFNDTSLP
jgi:hypothetical protein